MSTISPVMRAIQYGSKVKIVGPEDGKLAVLEPEDAIKLAHDILDKSDKVLKKLGESQAP